MPRRTIDSPALSNRVAALLLAWMLLLAFGLLPGPGANAADGINHAGVIVRQGDGSFVYGYVAFTEEQIDGVELLRRSGIPMVTAGFGGLGEAVCSLDSKGCGMAECRRNVCQSSANAPYWQFFRPDETGSWGPRILGASSTAVRDGDIDGWSWTASDAELPAISLPELAALAGADANLAPDASGYAGTWRSTQPPPPPASNQSTSTYVAAGAMLALLGGGAVIASIRRRGHAADVSEPGSAAT